MILAKLMLKASIKLERWAYRLNDLGAYLRQKAHMRFMKTASEARQKAVDTQFLW